MHKITFKCHFVIFFQGFNYLYLDPEDFVKFSAMHSVHAELIEENGESRYKITDIIGREYSNASIKQEVFNLNCYKYAYSIIISLISFFQLMSLLVYFSFIR